MKDIAVMALKPGMELSSDVFDYHNNLIVKSKTKVDAQVISKLNRHSIMVVNVMEDVDYATNYFEKIRFSDGFRQFENVYHKNLNEFKTIMHDFTGLGKTFRPNDIMQLYDDTIADIRNKELILDYLYNMMPSEDDLTYAHCFGSGLIAGVFCTWLGYDEALTRKAVLCSFLYDIGKLKLPNSLIWKPGKLTPLEFEQMKMHTVMGFQLLQNIDDLDDTVLRATLMHHERYDGSGYPSKLHDTQIDEMARLMAIIDTYDALTSARIYRASKHAFEVIEIFQKDHTKYDIAMMSKILSNLANHMVGLKVKLNDERIAEVIMINQLELDRPLLRDANQNFINLSLDRNLKILGIY